MREPLTEDALDQLAILAARAGIEQIANEARSLAARVAEGRFYLACVGQFKRGKSTLLDALLDDPVLPIGVLPVTAIPTVVRYGPEKLARVALRGAGWRQIDVGTLASYVSEEENPENEKDVAAVEVFLPNELLATGMCLVDTPGISSIYEANSAATYDFIPHIDAALVVLGADPPITGEELSLAMKINRQVEDVLFVISKADRASKDEVAAAKQFACSVLGNRLGRPIEIYEVSAKEQLEGNRENREWPAFAAALNHIGSSSGRRLVWLAQQRGVARLAAWLRATIAEERKALAEPLEQSEARLNDLNQYIEHSEQVIRDLGLLLLEEQLHLSNRLEQRRQSFIAHFLPSARNQLAARMASAPLYGPSIRRFAMQAALSIARDEVLPWLRKEEDIVEEEYARITERFTALANASLRALAEAGVSQLTHVGEAIEGCGQLAAHSHFQFHHLIHIAQPASPLRHAADFMMAAIGITGPIWDDAERFLDRVIETNTSRVQSDLERRLEIARTELQLAIRAVLVNAKDVAEATLARVRETKAAGDSAIHKQLAELAALDHQIAQVSRASLSRPANALRH